MSTQMTNPPSKTQRKAILVRLSDLVDKCWKAKLKATDEEFDDWYFCVVKRIGCFPEDVWTKTIDEKGHEYRWEQRQKLLTSLLISVCNAKTLGELMDFDQQVARALKGCPGCGVTSSSEQDGGSSEEPRKELTPEQASEGTSPKL